VSSEVSFLDLVPESLQQPQTYIVLFLVVFILVLFAIIYKRNLSISIFGKTLLDVQSKDVSGVTSKDTPAKTDTKPSVKSDVRPPSTNNKEVKKEKGAAHAGCPHVNDFILVITETTNVVSEISEIKYKGCMSEQMFRADQHLIRLRTLFQNKYRALLAKMVEESRAEEHNEISGKNLVAYKFYQALTRIMIQDVKDLIIRVALLNNHLAEFASQALYDVYIEKQFESIKNTINDTTIEMYMGDWLITQKSVMVMHEGLFPETKSIVQDIFNDSRDIAVRSQKKIEVMEKNLKDFVTKIAGINGQVV
jgi:hypothetical protein